MPETRQTGQPQVIRNTNKFIYLMKTTNLAQGLR